MNNYEELATRLLPVVLEAGRELMDLFGTDDRSNTKSDGSPVTEADLRSEAVILKALAQIAPSIPVISEEGADTQTATSVGSEFFLVDPMDGTREFLSGNTDFTVNIGLISKDTPTFGIVYAPARSSLYVALGSDHCLAANVPFQSECADLASLNARRIRVRDTTDTSKFVICASRSHRSKALEAYLQTFENAESLEVGSSLKLCMVAEGLADLYPRLGPTMEWDTAAGHAVVKAAGGHVINLDGTPLTYGKLDRKFLNPSFLVYGPRCCEADLHKALALSNDTAS